MRTGFTLIELLVAVLLIDVGVLAMVAGTAAIARRQTGMRARAFAGQVAANRIQRLMAGPCVAVAGSGINQDVTERYASIQTLPGVRDLEDSVTFMIDGAARAIVVRSRTSC